MKLDPKISQQLRNLKRLRNKIQLFQKHKKKTLRLGPILEWLEKKRRGQKAHAKIVSLNQLDHWIYDQRKKVVRHRKGAGYFFSVQGVVVKNASGTEVSKWNQPIFVQKEGGALIILCQEREDDIKFLLHAKYEPGNINKLQLAPTIQATQSNLKQHHSGRKPRFSEYINHPKTTVIYQALHNEEGARFWRKSNLNSIAWLHPHEKLTFEPDDDYIWLSIEEIKALMLFDHIVNPFVKTILSPL